MAPSSDKGDAGEELPPSLETFSDRLEAMRPRDEDENKAGGSSALGRALGASSHLLAGIFVGTMLGLLLDRWLGTAPWFLLVGIGFGFVAGVLNVVRLLK